MPLLKGANVGYGDSLAGYHSKANCVRLQFAIGKATGLPDPSNYWQYTKSALEGVDTFIQNTGLTIILDLCHWGPNGFTTLPNGTDRWADFSWNDFIGHWLVLAQRYKNNNRVILQNANEVGMSYGDADKFNDRFVSEMRKAKFNNTLMISPPYALPNNLKAMNYWGDANTWIDIHVYDPLSFTHAGIYGKPSPKTYTPEVQQRHDDALEQIRLHKNRQIFLGEFAVSKFNSLPEREKYYGKTIKFANANCVGWTYHSLGGGTNPWDPAGIKVISDELK